MRLTIGTLGRCARVNWRADACAATVRRAAARRVSSSAFQRRLLRAKRLRPASRLFTRYEPWLLVYLAGDAVHGLRENLPCRCGRGGFGWYRAHRVTWRASSSSTSPMAHENFRHLVGYPARDLRSPCTSFNSPQLTPPAAGWFAVAAHAAPRTHGTPHTAHRCDTPRTGRRASREGPLTRI